MCVFLFERDGEDKQRFLKVFGFVGLGFLYIFSYVLFLKNK